MGDNNDIGFLTRQIHESIKKTLDNGLQEHDLTMAQAQILGVLDCRRNTSTSVRDLEEVLHVTHPTVLGLLKRLEEKGFIRTETDEDDHRARNIVLMPKADSVKGQLIQGRIRIEEQAVEGFSPEEKEKLIELLVRVRKNLSVKE